MLDDPLQLEELEAKLKEALVQNDIKTLQKIIHPNFIYTDEFGTSFTCLVELQAISSHVVVLESVTVNKREINYFENVAVVNYNELRIGTLNGAPFETNYFVSRVWKKNAKWRLLSVTLVKL